jgi:hypothetical protein
MVLPPMMSVCPENFNQLAAGEFIGLVDLR